jgi:hypothetical protein
MSTSRVVTLLTPIFGALSAFVVAWASKHLPGIPVPGPEEITALEIAGFTGAVAIAAHWLHGNQLWEARKRVVGDVETGVHTITKADPDLIEAIEKRVDARVEAVLKGLEVKVTPQAPQAPAAT